MNKEKGESGTKYCCIESWKKAKDEAWSKRNFKLCKCDHCESCEHCYPPEFHTGGKWDLCKPREAERVELEKKRPLKVDAQMTKLTPIETLALETGLLLKTTNLDLCPNYLTKLEALRQAIISDFVSKLEPVGYCEKSQIEDVKDGGTGLFFDIKDEPYSTPLFDLTEWITK